MLILFRKSKVKERIVSNVNLTEKNKDKEIIVEMLILLRKSKIKKAIISNVNLIQKK
jgi:hypothetical protein